jgi:hypothetical protein
MPAKASIEPGPGRVPHEETLFMADDHDTVVVTERGGGTGTILGILAIILVLAGLWYFAMGPGAGGGDQTQEGGDVNIEVPVEPPAS